MLLKKMHQKIFYRESLGMECDMCTKHKSKTLSGVAPLLGRG